MKDNLKNEPSRGIYIYIFVIGKMGVERPTQFPRHCFACRTNECEIRWIQIKSYYRKMYRYLMTNNFTLWKTKD